MKSQRWPCPDGLCLLGTLRVSAGATAIALAAEGALSESTGGPFESEGAPAGAAEEELLEDGVLATSLCRSSLL